MINPLDRVASSLPPARAAAAASREPKDEVRLGERPAAPPSLPRTARAADLRETYRLHAVLADEKTPPEEFSEAAYALARIASASADTLVRKIGQSVLSEYVHLDDPAQKSALVKGPVQGPAEHLAWIERQVDPSCTYFVPEKSVIPYLQVLHAGAHGTPVPEGALRAVAHLACRFAERSGYDLSPGIRKEESPEDDRRYAGACASLVERWWRQGQIEVRRDGQPVPPGTLDLGREVSARRVAVLGSRIELAAPRPADPDVAALLKKVSAWGEDPIAEAVAELKARPGLAAGLAASDEFEKVGRLLAECPEPFRPHLETLRGFAARAQAQGALESRLREPEGLLRFYDRVLTAFPEAADERMARESLAPLYAAGELQSDHAMRKTLKALWDRHPDLARPMTEETLTLCAGKVPTRGQIDLMAEAARRGWQPRPEHVAGLAAKLVPAPSRDPASVFSGYVSADDFRATLKLLGTLEPRLLESLDLPDHRGELVPLKDGVLDRLLTDAGGDLGRLEKGDSTSAAAYAWIFPDRRLGDALLESLEAGLAKAGSLEAMPREAQQAAAVLGAVALTPEQEARLGRALARCLDQRQGYYVLKDLVERFRGPEIARLLAQATFDSSMRALELILASGHDHPRDVDPALAPMWAAAEAGAADRLSAAVAEVLARRGSLKQMTVAETAQAEALAYQGGLGEVLGPALLADHGFPTKRIYEVVQKARMAEVDRVQQALRDGSLRPAERLALVSRARDLSTLLAFAPKERETATLQAWRAGVTASGSGDWTEALPLARACDLYALLAPKAPTEAVMAAEVERFGEVLGKLGLDRFDEAVEAWREVERQVADGVGREAAVRNALLRYVGGGESDEPAREIREGTSEIQVGGISLPILSRPE